MCDDLDRFLRQLGSAIMDLPASAPADCAGEDRLYYLQFATDARELLVRGESLRQRLAASTLPPTSSERRTLPPLPLA